MRELHDQSTSHFRFAMPEPLRKWGFIAGVLVVTHLVAAKIGYDRLNENVFPGLTINSPLTDWAKATGGADSTTYLTVALNVAKGKGLVQNPDANYSNEHPFCFWGPGAPLALGTWLRLTHGRTVWWCFLFTAIMLLFWGATVVATAAVFTRRTWALATTAFLSGCCPPLHHFFYSRALANSEIVALVPLGMMFLALSKASQLWITPRPRISSVIMWCTSAGVWLGLASLVRDSLSAFAWFTAVFLLFSTWLRSYRSIGIALASGCVLLAATEAVRYPVKQWNLARINKATISTSSEVAIWRTGLWAKHDAYPFYLEVGIGLGEFLDPKAAQRVQDYFNEQKPMPALYSFLQLVQAVWNHPLEALEFKLSKMSQLWFSIPRWSLAEFNFVAAWCVIFYGLLFLYAVIQIKARRSIPASLYLYLLFVVCSSALIHFEFRYTFPIWQMLVILPAIWAAHLAECAQTLKTVDASADAANDSPAFMPPAQSRLSASC